jgi:hypothetical protein
MYERWRNSPKTSTNHSHLRNSNDDKQPNLQQAYGTGAHCLGGVEERNGDREEAALRLGQVRQELHELLLGSEAREERIVDLL